MPHLPDSLAEQADAMLCETLEAAATQVTIRRQDLDGALQSQFIFLAVNYPELFLLCLVRLQQTDNDDMLEIAKSAAARVSAQALP